MKKPRLPPRSSAGKKPETDYELAGADFEIRLITSEQFADNTAAIPNPDVLGISAFG